MNSPEHSFRVISRNGGLWLNKDGWTFNLDPPETIKLSMPPYMEGVGWFVSEAARMKGIESEYMDVKFSQSLFLGCDASLSYADSMYGGWSYSVNKEFLDFETTRRLWICPQMKIYFDSPPREIFISVERA